MDSNLSFDKDSLIWYKFQNHAGNRVGPLTLNRWWVHFLPGKILTLTSLCLRFPTSHIETIALTGQL